MLYTFLQEHAIDLVMSKVMSIGDVFIRGGIWLWGKGYYMRRGKSYYKKGEIWLYSRISPGERLLYSQFSGGKATI